ncbi:MAG: ATP-dependent DNA helicase RecG [Clostridiales bacterium]|nr:ATP-dependent DNA helicase RecG [Clostridiales bacterium]
MGSTITFDTKITALPGIGVKRAEAFAKLGIFCAGDLLYHFPRAYQHRGKVKPLCEAEDGEVCAVMLTIAKEPVNVTVKGRMTLTKVVAFDETRRCQITFFNQSYLKDVFRIGAAYRFYGKVTLKNGQCEMVSPAFEPYIPGVPLPEFFPVYPLSEGLTQKTVKDAIRFVMDHCDLEKEDVLPDSVRRLYSQQGEDSDNMPGNMPGLHDAMRFIHDPADYAQLNAARNRFIFEELFVFSMGLSLSRKPVQRRDAPVMHQVDATVFYQALPFAFTPAQQRCAQQIEKDLINEEGTPMARLLSGDVGSGKTVVAALAAYLCVKNDYQCALMAPTGILARQHYEDLSDLLGRLGVETALLTGSTKAAEKRSIYAGLAEGRIQLVIGTHALITEAVQFHRLGLVITDEQHRFGVRQRAALAEKGKEVHMLVMSATPIPRTLSLILYGDLQISEIDELPPGRQQVDTFVVNESYRQRLNGFIEKCIAGGGQVYIVCPSVEPSEEELVDLSYKDTDEALPKLKSAVAYTEQLQREFPDRRVDFVHGKLKEAQKERVMTAFAAGDIDILVSTTVIEVGVNVPNASLMIVENAERFGLSQLHQLRGRVGRGKRKSYCVFVSDAKSDTAKKRLQALKENQNGYKIAEIDLTLRGPGDFLPTREGGAKQHGALHFKLANLCDDLDLLKAAFRAAESVAGEDPLLAAPEHARLKAQLANLWTQAGTTLN